MFLKMESQDIDKLQHIPKSYSQNLEKLWVKNIYMKDFTHLHP